MGCPDEDRRDALLPWQPGAGCVRSRPGGVTLASSEFRKER